MSDYRNRGEIVDFGAGKVVPVQIVQEMKNSYIDYAMSVIVMRALPDVRDARSRYGTE